MIEIDTVEKVQNEWRNPYVQWWAAGMPAYYSSESKPFHQMQVKFKTKEDKEEFLSLLNISITDKTNFIWFPPRKNEENIKNRYVEIDEV